MKRQNIELVARRLRGVALDFDPTVRHTVWLVNESAGHSKFYKVHYIQVTEASLCVHNIT